MPRKRSNKKKEEKVNKSDNKPKQKKDSKPVSHCAAVNDLRGKDILNMDDEDFGTIITPTALRKFSYCGVRNAYQCTYTDCINHVE